MDLTRLYAYAVGPAREKGDVPTSVGGALKVNADIKLALDDAFMKSNLARESTIDFCMDPASRSNEVRDLVMTMAFEPPKAKGTATVLANRLAQTMDKRSRDALLVLAVAEEDDNRRLTIWAFPRDNAFQFHDGSRGPTVKLLNDVFSQSSRLRKAALFEGKNVRTDFLSGRVIDAESTGSFGKGANFWIEQFLGCRLGVDGEIGTRMLADCLRKVHATTVDPDEKEQINAAILAIRTSPKKKWSIRRFARNYLQGSVEKALINAAPNQDAANVVFDFNRDVFEKTVNLRVFRLKSDVFVSAPFAAVGQSVKIHGKKERTLTCKGLIVDERVRARHA